ncbi:DUF4330 domain-containing protein [Clostridium sp. Cult3]|uniref:DUF4330 domain-containing protein n=1 Tax=Clostridium sp. Cult3 TaxID=2079004 RepID=UPI001F417BAB|nr:DUF4330 domain-containing protein [Clostridium sp. Cult3]MCF6460444.1 hypothetical protein [Clostridium sp. Cult3]
MKIINEKGKLFGIINIIDLIVLLVIVLLVGGGVKRMKKNPAAVAETKKALITIEVSDIRTPTVDGIVVGDPLYHYDKGEKIGEIVDKKIEAYKEPVESGDGKWILAEVPEKYVVLMTVEAEVKENPDVVIAGGEQIRIGTQFKLKNRNVAVLGTILGVEVE